MKLVYKLGNDYFNIKQLRQLTNITITNDYIEQEKKLEFDKRVEESSPFKNTKSSFLYKQTPIKHHYDKDCETISITIDGIKYSKCNYKDVSDNNLTSIWVADYKVLNQLQKEFDQFKEEAIALLEAFKKL